MSSLLNHLTTNYNLDSHYNSKIEQFLLDHANDVVSILDELGNFYIILDNIEKDIGKAIPAYNSHLEIEEIYVPVTLHANYVKETDSNNDKHSIYILKSELQSTTLLRQTNYEWLKYTETIDPITQPVNGQYRCQKGSDTYLYPWSGLYISGNYTIMSAASICQQHKIDSTSTTNPIHWSDVITDDKNHHYFITKYNPHLLEDFKFGTIQTHQYAIDNYNFIPTLYQQDSKTYLLHPYSKQICLNQGLGCGNVLPSPSDMVLMLMQFLFGEVKPFTKSFIDTYILARDYTNNEIYNNGVMDNFLSGGINYTSGLMNYGTSTSEPKGDGTNYQSADPIIAHPGESYGAETECRTGTSDDGNAYIATACAAGFENDKTLSQSINQYVFDYLVGYYYWEDQDLDTYLNSIKEKIQMGFSEFYQSYGTNIFSTVNPDKPAYFSISWLVCSTKEEIKKTKVYNFTVKLHQNTDLNNLDIEPKTYNEVHKYSWGSCCSKFLSTINSMCMAWYLNYGDTHMTPHPLNSKEQKEEDLKMWDCLDMPIYHLLTNDVTDYNLKDRKQSTNFASGLLKPLSNGSPIGIKTMYDNQFRNPLDSNQPATNYGQFTLKKLGYMQSNMNDFDGEGPNNNSACVCKITNKQTPTSIKGDADDGGGYIPIYTQCATAGVFNACSWLNSDCNELPLCEDNKDGNIVTGEYLNIPYGPMQWLQCAIYSLDDNAIKLKNPKSLFKPKRAQFTKSTKPKDIDNEEQPLSSEIYAGTGSGSSSRYSRSSSSSGSSSGSSASSSGSSSGSSGSNSSSASSASSGSSGSSSSGSSGGGLLG